MSGICLKLAILAIIIPFGFAHAIGQNDATFEIKSEAPSITPKLDGAPEQISECFKKYEEGKCLRQADAFQVAGQAATYLAYYMQHVKIPEPRRKLIKEAFARCSDPNQVCERKDQELILAAAIQRNLGKEIRSMVLTNNTNMEKMKSLSDDPAYLFDGKHNISFGNADQLKQPFRLNPEEIDDSPAAKLANKEARENEILGDKFLSEYKIFLDTYSKTSGQYQYVDSRGTTITEADKKRWHYVSEKVDSKRSGGEVFINKNDINTQGFESDRDSQDKPMVGDLVKQIEDDSVNRAITPEERAEKIANQMDTLMLNPRERVDVNGKKVETKDIHRQMAGELNSVYEKAIEDSKREKLAAEGFRNPASNPGEKELNLVVKFDPDKFSQFLDEIWPPSAAKPASN